MKSKSPRRARASLRLFPALAALCALLAFLAYGGLSPRPSIDSTDYSVHFIDVGQGDAALLALGGEFVLIDAGTTNAAPTVTAYLESLGVRRLAAVIASHPHEDHIGGLPAVLSSYGAQTLYLPNASSSTRAYERLLDAIEAEDIRTVVPAPGDSIFINGAEITFLSPDPAAISDNINDASLIVRVNVGSDRLLFVGDAESGVLASLAGSGADLACDIYKVGHHGSRDSSPAAFLQAASPRIAVISCGQDNSYGHPHDEALRRLEAAGAQIYITAQDGTVTLPLTAPSSPSQKENAS